MNEELTNRGGRLLAVSADAPADARRIVERHGLDFAILVDTERVVMEAYGIVHPGGGLDGADIAVPAQILIDRDGRIVWRFVSRRIQDRLDPSEVLGVVKAMGG